MIEALLSLLGQSGGVGSASGPMAGSPMIGGPMQLGMSGSQSMADPAGPAGQFGMSSDMLKGLMSGQPMGGMSQFGMQAGTGAQSQSPMAALAGLMSMAGPTGQKTSRPKPTGYSNQYIQSLMGG